MRRRLDFRDRDLPCAEAATVPPGGRRGVARWLLLGAVIAATAVPGTWGGEPGVAVYRTMLPECGPSSFAVALGPGLGFSFDPGRGGVNYVWQGEFVDLGPTWRAKINQPADLRGPIIYRESVRFPLRLGVTGREPKFEFKGYALQPDAVEFHYLLDGVLVREEVRASAKGRGLIRCFRVDEPVSGWSYALEPQPGVKASVPGGAWNEARTALVAPGGREFALTIEFAGATP